MIMCVGHSTVLVVGACKESVQQVLLECAPDDIQRLDFLDYHISSIRHWPLINAGPPIHMGNAH